MGFSPVAESGGYSLVEVQGLLIVVASLVAQLVKNLPAMRLRRSPGGGKGYPLQYSGLENSMDCPCGHKESDTNEQLSLLLS